MASRKTPGKAGAKVSKRPKAAGPRAKAKGNPRAAMAAPRSSPPEPRPRAKPRPTPTPTPTPKPKPASKPAPRKKAARSRKVAAATSSHVAAGAAVPGTEADPAALAKLALGPGAERSEPRPSTIPWSYGLDRITAVAIDPDRLYAWWEVTDAAIEKARQALGAGGAGAWLCLRVYDTTGRLFDGANAHGHFDQGIDRATRDWFFQVGKPTSTAFVEVGLRSGDGAFARIARSGRVDFPRREPAPWSDPEWMTVETWSGQVSEIHRSSAPAPGPAAHTGPPAAGGAAPPRFEQIPPWLMRDPIQVTETILREAAEHGWERVDWKEESGEGWSASEGRLEWESPRVISSWEAGPFTDPVEIVPPSREAWQGRAFAWRVGRVTHVVHGPWRVVIRNLASRAEHAVPGAWSIYRSWAVEAGREVRAGRRAVVRSGASELLALGASERRWLAGSEARLGGASELWRAGASELAYRGASEQRFLGASQVVARGASERRLGGASERSLAGGSEGRLGGASEQRAAGEGTAWPAAPDLPTREG
jgi:hypothetical protein